MPKNRYDAPGAIGSDVVLLLHSLRFDATVTEEHEDGSIKVIASSKTGDKFPKSRVKRAPADTSKLDPAVPYWTTREALAEAAELAALETQTKPDTTPPQS